MGLPVKGSRLARGFGLVAAGTLAFGLAACTKAVRVQGNMPDPEVIAEIQPGIDDRNVVVDKLGSPSTISTFIDNKWYYIGQKTEQFAFLDPDILERSVLVVSFDQNGVVDDTLLYTLEDGQIVDPVDRITPTEGKELNVLQQLFGNIGRFPTEVGGQ